MVNGIWVFCAKECFLKELSCILNPQHQIHRSRLDSLETQFKGTAKKTAIISCCSTKPYRLKVDILCLYRSADVYLP